MNKVLNIVLMSLIPTLGMCIMVSNMFRSQTDSIGLHVFTIFTFSFSITFFLCSLLLKIEKLEMKVKDIETKLEKIENKQTNE